MSCEVELTCAVLPLPHTGKGLDPPPAHTAAALAEHVSIPQHPGIQHRMGHPHCTLLARMQLEKKKAWVWSRLPEKGAKVLQSCFVPCTENFSSSVLAWCEPDSVLKWNHGDHGMGHKRAAASPLKLPP